MDEITVPRAVFQKLFDTAINSMDFGSGFLDDDEVEACRRSAKLLGVDPMTATPDAYKSKYPHPFVPGKVYLWPRSSMSSEAAAKDIQRQILDLKADPSTFTVEGQAKGHFTVEACRECHKGKFHEVHSVQP